MNGDVLFKEFFLREVIEKEYPSDSTILNNYAILFEDNPMSVFKAEKRLSKDFYNFNREEILETLASFRSSSFSTLKTQFSLLKKYSSYAYHEGKSVMPLPINNITSKDLYKCISEYKLYEKYMTQKQLYSKIPLLLNNSDKLLYILYYKGVYGKANSEIINLKKTDYDYSTKTLTVDGRIYEFDEYEADIMDKAISEEEYNSYVSNDAKSYPIIDSEYIFRNLEGTTTIKDKEDFDINKLNNNMILRRIQMSTKHIGEKLWSSNTIYRSGVAMRILEEYDFREIADRDIRHYKKKYELTFDPIAMMDIIKIVKDKFSEETAINSKEV